MALALSIPTGQAGVGSRFVSERADGEADACAAPAELPDVLRAAAGGDEEAWRIIVRLYGRRVFALVQSRCRQADLSEEITQSVFVTVAAKLREGAYTESGRFEAWIFRIAVNRLRDELRKRKRRAGTFVRGEDEASEAAALPEPERAGAEELARLRSALAGLNEADRDVIELRHHGGMSFKDIAALRGEPLGTLLARHHRALRKLRQCLEELERSAEGGRSTGTA
mgnify:CR=1 FL=1|jgi:RNA polymerase sigma-70 factor (ECF subfamily)